MVFTSDLSMTALGGAAENRRQRKSPHLPALQTGGSQASTKISGKRPATAFRVQDFGLDACEDHGGHVTICYEEQQKRIGFKAPWDVFEAAGSILGPGLAPTRARNPPFPWSGQIARGQGWEGPGGVMQWCFLGSLILELVAGSRHCSESSSWQEEYQCLGREANDVSTNSQEFP